MRQESLLVRSILIGAVFLLTGLILILPIYTVFHEAFSKGIRAYLEGIQEPDTLSALKLTLLVVSIAVPLNTIFGIVSAFSLTRFEFPGKSWLLTIIDSPFSVSPVISGLIFILLFGRQGWFGPWLEKMDIKIVFNIPGLVIATIFITLPFVARELIPLLDSTGIEEEEAGLLLGASPTKVFFKIVTPGIKYGLLYGIILCNARAMGEFGAVSVLSGHIRGQTNTLPLQIEVLYNEYNSVAAFSAASLLVFLSLVTLVAKQVLESKIKITRKEELFQEEV
ncbi:sulfate ABC transporter permease subunit CysW [Leptospira borgpetersenii]|uniref:sulfate ABC transporter permease subunit CysW n=1 Tax=Leptospira borgpetersenii TaxID=174 RepID=UPI0007742FEE|nr:sulfate ABC transporter permease subunit CysW [Leptospira borgpetersenii]MBE8400986.1 sulfate ABC transporter permease subunit CysW [Leptospira borgpetersenii serovar Tarassovi]MBE8404018.1 sulfate ABC transporter permease subunit CysW [Leptospira borgpetersenii serovar Tarassovi]MBE8407079.1 sulfate ABC transporter permease subunit CysW [Leptospira borgpetersenii serovar Tarassovi]MBE8413352.1 sulfate ABC transporter permease subunit CysW [Leptospira borgpetersenii serovar Tarassovi]MBE841